MDEVLEQIGRTDFGALTGVLVDRADPDDRLFSHVRFVFTEGAITIAWQTDDAVTVSVAASPDAGTLTPWAHPVARSVRGRSLMWAWAMTNQHRTVDGFQVELVGPRMVDSVILQVMAEGVGLTISSVVELS